jgi:nucleoside-diphosphate-sugar epimerase
MHAILGGSGNVGRLLTEYISNKQEKVVSLGRSVPEKKLDGVEYKTVDYFDVDSLVQGFEGAKYVYLLVGLEYKAKVWREYWPKLMQSVVEACHQTGSKLIFFDNVYCYGLVNGEMTEETPWNPCSQKGKVRAEIAKYMLDTCSEGYISGTILRAADFYGPGITTSAVGARFFEQLKMGTVETVGDVSKIHTFTYVPDCVPALYELAMDTTNNGEVFHAPSTSEPLSQLEFAKIAAKMMGVEIKKTVQIQGFILWMFSFFAPVLKEFKEMLYQFTNDYCLNSDKILKRYPNLKVTNYKDGLTKTISSL